MQPGQTFSFVARNVKGQNVVDVSDAKPLGGASAAMM